jgi:hypothetical protein
MITMLLVMPQVETLPDNYALLKNQQRRLPWRIHQSEVVENYGKCCWEDCPGKKLSMAKRPRSSSTHMRCKECSTYLVKDMFLFSSFVKVCAGELTPALPHIPL